MGRKTDTAGITAALEAIDTRIAEIKKHGYLTGYQIRLSYPRGTASKRSQLRCYPRLLNQATGKTTAIAPESLGEYERQIEAGRELARLDKQRERLLERLGKATTHNPAPVVDIPIDALDITAKKRVILRSLGIATATELIARWPIDHRGLGEQGKAEIREALRAAGLAVAG